MKKLGPLFLLLGLMAGCGSGQTQADTPVQQHRCGDPQMRCGTPDDDDEPPKAEFAKPPKVTIPPATNTAPQD